MTSETEPTTTPSTPLSTPLSAPPSAAQSTSDSEPGLAREIFRALPRGVRWFLWLCVGLVLALIVTGVAGFVVVRRPLPVTSGQLTVPGLSSVVTVTRDARGVPTLWADSDHDLMLAEGYVHAQERFYEMDVRRHLTAGRLAELFGEPALATDKMVRTMGWRRVAEQELSLLTPETRADLDAYADGVNAYLDGRSSSQLSVEYTLLGLTGLDYTPDPWSAVDSLAWLKAMAWDLKGNLDQEVARVAAGVNHTPEQVAELFPSYDERRPPIVQGGAVVDGVFDQDATKNSTRLPMRPAFTPGAVQALEAARDNLNTVPPLVGRGDGIGSNSWVVSGRYTVTGKPILANDPHLGVSQPGVWMQIGLRCRQLNADCGLGVSGFSFAGVPGVVIGHNDHIAWGMTNMGPDVTDFYLEKVSPDGVLYDGKVEPLKVRTETIKVRGGDDFRLQVRSSRHGPLVSDVSSEWSSVGANAAVEDDSPPAAYAVALRWTALDPGNTADAIRGLNRAGNYAEFRAAARDFQVPAQNLVYADTDGHIAYQAPGRIPIRKSGNDGTVPVAGWLPENDWSGKYVDFDALPRVLDPEEGFIVAANQQVIGESYPYLLTRDPDYGFRAQQIRQQILDHNGISLEETLQTQTDTFDLMALTLVPYLLHVNLGTGYAADGQRLLQDWDLRDDPDSAAAAYFQVTWDKLLELTFDDELRPAARPTGGSRWFEVVSRLLVEPTSSWWDDVRTDDVVETRDDILVKAMQEAREELTQLRDHNPTNWAWGDLHRLNLRSKTLGDTGISPVSWLLNRSYDGLGGSSSVVNATSWDAQQDYQVTSAPSMRMVVDLGDLDRSRWIALTGVSGHAASAHYDDQTEAFIRGDTYPWPFGDQALKAATEDTLTLKPGDTE